MIQETIARPKVKFASDVKNQYREILTEQALTFLTALHEKFDAQRLQLLERRVQQQTQFDKGKFPEFPRETEHIRNGDWLAGSIPHDLLDRRVEITGPVDRKMVINALNSGAKTFMADFEDSNSPTWSNTIEGQHNLIDANKKTISFYDVKREKSYSLNDETAVLLVRPRGLHLNERHLIIKGKEISGSLVDFRIIRIS